jgi:valyl-tRNA synthetase
MLGDEAVAIHPKDSRYTYLHGRSAYHPFRHCTIPIIEDEILVDMEFGTGVVKVTPAHDPNDFECGVRHHLKFTNILIIDGKINGIVPEFQRMHGSSGTRTYGRGAYLGSCGGAPHSISRCCMQKWE